MEKLQTAFNCALELVRDSGVQPMDGDIGREVWAYVLNWYHHKDAWRFVDRTKFRVETQRAANGKDMPLLQLCFTQKYDTHEVGWDTVTRNDIKHNPDGRDHRERMQAFRRAIQDQIDDWRETTEDTPPCDDAHVDHEYEFLYLVDDWARTVVGVNSMDDIKTRRLVAGGAEIADAAEKRSWQIYHGEEADLRWLSPMENCSRPKPVLGGSGGAK